MAAKKYSDFPAAGPLTGSEIMPLMQGGVTVQSTPTAIQSFLSPAPAPPPQAAAAGYNLLTFGPNVTLGQNWFPFNFLGVSTPGPAIQNPDGSVTLTGETTGFNADICTTHRVGGTWAGWAMGGGGYIEFVLKFTPTLGPSTFPFPAWWALDNGFLNSNPVQWFGQTQPYTHRVEVDYGQYLHNNTGLLVGIESLDWYGPGSSNSILNLSGVSATAALDGSLTCSTTGSPTILVGAFVTVSGTAGGTGSIVGYSNPTIYQVLATNGKTTLKLGTVGGGAVTTTAGTITGLAWQINAVGQPTPDRGAAIKITQDATRPPLVFSNYNRYGCLWIPATATTKGTLINYLNGVPVIYVGVNPAPNITWNQYNPANPPPPILGDNAGSLLDTLQMAQIIGTDVTSPMTIASVTVWQNSTAGNVSQ